MDAAEEHAHVDGAIRRETPNGFQPRIPFDVLVGSIGAVDPQAYKLDGGAQPRFGIAESLVAIPALRRRRPADAGAEDTLDAPAVRRQDRAACKRRMQRSSREPRVNEGVGRRA